MGLCSSNKVANNDGEGVASQAAGGGGDDEEVPVKTFGKKRRKRDSIAYNKEAMAKRESAGGARHVPESMVERIE
jgi:hypothetical protein